MQLEGGVSSRRHGDRWVIELIGEHDLSTVPMLTASIAELDASVRLIEVDLRQAEFIDSAVIGALLLPAAEVRELVLVAPTGTPPRRVLDLVGVAALRSVLETSPSGEVQVALQEAPSCP